MAMVSKTMNILEGLVREKSFKWLLSGRSSFEEELEEMAHSPSAHKNWIPQLSPVANIVVRRCSRIIGISMHELQEKFDSEASESMKKPSEYAQNILEYCCFTAMALSTQMVGHLADKNFRRLTYDMMLAWEAAEAGSRSFLKVKEDATVGRDAFSRIAPAVPLIANVIVSDNIFEVLTTFTGGRLQYSVYEKYLTGLERSIRKLKTQSNSTLLASPRNSKGEKILEVDGTVTAQPVLEHIGISTWPGRLTLTDHALYFEAFKVMSYDKAKRYDLSDDVKQLVKPELTGPWGTRLFDRAVSYKSISLSEPVMFEFPELKGHTRRDYWLAIIREILYVHQFIRKFKIVGVQREDILSKAVLGILRVQAIQEISSSNPVDHKALLMFNLCDQLPGGDNILEALAGMSTPNELNRTKISRGIGGMYSMSALDMVSNLGFSWGASSSGFDDDGLHFGEVTVGGMTPLEKAVKESKRSYKKVVLAQATVNGVKVEGIDTNLAVMQFVEIHKISGKLRKELHHDDTELLFPVIELKKWLFSLAYWDDPLNSLAFCSVFSYIICKGLLGYAFAAVVIFMAIFMLLSRLSNHGRPIDALKVLAPPTMTKVDQILAVQNAVSRAEVLLQNGNVALLKLRGLLLSIFPQASEKFAAALLFLAVILAFLPSKYIVLLVFLDTFTRYSPPRRANTERWMRRMREWWFSVPAAPVLLEKGSDQEEKRRQ